MTRKASTWTNSRIVSGKVICLHLESQLTTGNWSLWPKKGSSADQGEGIDLSVFGEGVHSKQEPATNVKLGMRMRRFKVLNQSDARPWHLQEQRKSDGRWRLSVFCGYILDDQSSKEMLALRIAECGEFVHQATYTP